MSNPEVAELLSPKNVLGCKRLCVDTGYRAKYNRSNVTFIEVSREPIEAITPAGFHVRDREYAVDAIVLATGFDAITGALLKIDIRGTGGRALEEKRCEGSKTYLGLGIAGFPTCSRAPAPAAPPTCCNRSSSTSNGTSIVSVICATAAASRRGPEGRRGLGGACPRIGRWLTALDCSSWCIGANVPAKPRVFIPYSGRFIPYGGRFPTYVQKCETVAGNRYEGFILA